MYPSYVDMYPSYVDMYPSYVDMYPIFHLCPEKIGFKLKKILFLIL